MHNMKTTTVSSTDLKRDTAGILNSVIYGGIEAVVERYGEAVAKIVPIKKERKKRDWIKIIDKYYGAIPDFPEVHKMRYSRKRDVSW